MFNAKLELVGEVSQFLMRIYKGVPGRGGTPYGEQASYTLLKSAGEEEVAAEEVTEMEPDAEIPKEEPTEPEEVVEAEPVTEAIPPEEEAPSEEEAVEQEPDEVTEEPTPPPEPEPEPEPGITIHFSPESPHTIDGTEPVTVHGEVTGITEKDRFYVQVVRQGSNGSTIPVGDRPLNPEGARTATTRCS